MYEGDTSMGQGAETLMQNFVSVVASTFATYFAKQIRAIALSYGYMLSPLPHSYTDCYMRRGIDNGQLSIRFH